MKNASPLNFFREHHFTCARLLRVIKLVDEEHLEGNRGGILPDKLQGVDGNLEAAWGNCFLRSLLTAAVLVEEDYVRNEAFEVVSGDFNVGTVVGEKEVVGLLGEIFGSDLRKREQNLGELDYSFCRAVFALAAQEPSISLCHKHVSKL